MRIEHGDVLAAKDRYLSRLRRAGRRARDARVTAICLGIQRIADEC